MSKTINFGEGELAVMHVIWQAGEPVNSQYIGAAVADKQWKRTTISTFLTRLTEKGALQVEKRGNSYYYTPLISAGEYRRDVTQHLIASLYGGSAKDLAAALVTEEALSPQDIAELRAVIDGKEG